MCNIYFSFFSSDICYQIYSARYMQHANSLCITHVVFIVMYDGDWSKRRQAKTATVKTATEKNARSQNGDKKLTRL